MRKIIWFIICLALMTPIVYNSPVNAAEESSNWVKTWEVDIKSVAQNIYQPRTPSVGPDGELYFLTNDKYENGKVNYKLTSVSPNGKVDWVYSFTIKSMSVNDAQVSIPGDGYVYIIDYAGNGSPYSIHKVGSDGKLKKKINIPYPKKPGVEESPHIYIKIDKDGKIRVAYEDQKNYKVHMYLMNQDSKILWQTFLKKTKTPEVPIKVTDNDTVIVPQGDNVEVYSPTGKLLFRLAKNKEESFEFFKSQDGMYVGRGYYAYNSQKTRLVGISKDGKIKWTKKFDSHSLVYQYKNQMYHTIALPGQYYQSSALILFNPKDGKEMKRFKTSKSLNVNDYPARGAFRIGWDYKNDPFIFVTNYVPSISDPKRDTVQSLLLDPNNFSVFQDVTNLRTNSKTGFYNFVIQGTKEKPYLIGYGEEKIYRYDLKK